MKVRIEDIVATALGLSLAAETAEQVGEAEEAMHELRNLVEVTSQYETAVHFKTRNGKLYRVVVEYVANVG